MGYVEIALITAAFLVFVFQEYFLDFGALTTGPSIIAFFLCASFHTFVFSEVASAEFYPYKTLRASFLNQLLFKILLCFSLLSFVTLLLLDSLLPAELRENLLIVTLGHLTLICVKALFVFLPLIFFTPTDLTICRLSLRTALIGLRLIDAKNKKVDRARLVSKYLKYFFVGLNSYNRYLYKQKPKHMGIVGTNDCYRIVYCVGLIGNPTERAKIARQIRRALDSIEGKFRRRDFRQFLIALKNIKNIEDKDDYSISELSEMIRITSFSERAKERLESPLFLGIVSLITVIPIIIDLIMRYF
jgi:hypothetical protein